MSAFVGRITTSGYDPQPGTRVRWTRHGGKELSFVIRPAFPWDGLNSSSDQYFARYANGQGKLVEGMYIIGVNDKLEGGEAFAILNELFRQAGIGRIPTRQESWDFAICNHDGRGGPLTAEDWPRLTGRPSPIQQPPGKKPVDPPPQPVTPPVLPPAAGLAPLSPASRRVEELRDGAHSIAEAINGTAFFSWLLDDDNQSGGFDLLKPFAVEALRMWRLLRRKLGDTRPIPKEDS